MLDKISVVDEIFQTNLLFTNLTRLRNDIFVCVKTSVFGIDEGRLV